jgi:hypothetical protein
VLLSASDEALLWQVGDSILTRLAGMWMQREEAVVVSGSVAVGSALKTHVLDPSDQKLQVKIFTIFPDAQAVGLPL